MKRAPAMQVAVFLDRVSLQFALRRGLQPGPVEVDRIETMPDRREYEALMNVARDLEIEAAA